MSIAHVGGLAYKGLQVHPIDRTVEEVLESGEYLSFARQQARKLARQQARKLAMPQEAGGFKLCVIYAVAEK